ncbi:phage GP46 family protein [Pseudomonas fluorescens group sp. PF-69]
MSDIRTVWVAETGQGDWQVLDGALDSGDDMASAVFISLFSDRQANSDDVLPDGSTDRRGWWGDLGQPVPLGSRLWLLSRSRLDDNAAKMAVIYAKEALQWLLDDQVAESVTVTATIQGPKQLNVAVTVTQRTGTKNYQFAWAWNQLS